MSDPTRTTLTVDTGTHRLRGFVRADPDFVSAAPRPLVYCLPGGGCTSAYFDLAVPGHDGYSMAAHLAERGAVVVSLDHPGIGASDEVADLFALTPTAVAAQHHEAHQIIVARARAGSLAAGLPPVTDVVSIGLGHSMGGMLLDVQQARHRTFRAVIGLGHGGSGLPEVLTPDELALADRPLDEIEDRLVELARLRFAADSPVERRPPATGVFFTDEVPPAVRQAFAAQQTTLLPTCGLTSMLPGSTATEKAAIAVPLFLGFGEHDLLSHPQDAFARYRAVTDAAFVVLRGAGHCHNQASGRAELWSRISGWIESVSRRTTP